MKKSRISFLVSEKVKARFDVLITRLREQDVFHSRGSMFHALIQHLKPMAGNVGYWHHIQSMTSDEKPAKTVTVVVPEEGSKDFDALFFGLKAQGFFKSRQELFSKLVLSLPNSADLQFWITVSSWRRPSD